jgi:hypothetical protein
MRMVALASALLISSGFAAVAFPVTSQPILLNAVLVHGCHHNYAHGVAGWHRHDQGCRTLQGIAGRKGRNPPKS